MSETGEFVTTDGINFEAASDADAYNDPWEVEDATVYIGSGNLGGGGGGGGGVANRGTGPARLTVISRSGDRVTVRNNTQINISGSVPFGGSGTLTIPPGGTFTGKDTNRNNNPDLLESCLSRGICFFPQ